MWVSYLQGFLLLTGFAKKAVLFFIKKKKQKKNNGIQLLSMQKPTDWDILRYKGDLLINWPFWLVQFVVIYWDLAIICEGTISLKIPLTHIHVFSNIKLMISIRKTNTQLRDMIKKISKNKANSCCICWAEVNKIWYQLNE